MARETEGFRVFHSDSVLWTTAPSRITGGQGVLALLPAGEAGSGASHPGAHGDPHPGRTPGGAELPWEGQLSLGSPGQLWPLHGQPCAQGQGYGNIDWRCPLKSSNLGTIKGCFQ